MQVPPTSVEPAGHTHSEPDTTKVKGHTAQNPLIRSPPGVAVQS